MKLCEALYIAFVIGRIGKVYRYNWKFNNGTKDKRIEDLFNGKCLIAHPSEEYNFIELTEKLKNKITRDAKRGISNKYGLDLTDEDVNAEDWIVDYLRNVSDRFPSKNKGVMK